VICAVVGLVWYRHRGADPVPPLVGLKVFEVHGAGDHTTADVPYTQIPPVGGPHDPRWQNCGFYPRPVRAENAVHSMEHGAVWITYRPSLPETDRAAVRAAVGTSPYVLASPYPGLPGTVVLSSWGYQLRLDRVDPDRIGQFIRAFAGSVRVPEPAGTCTNGIGNPK
jgi:hypothetical protein